eukprot:TRINITY_DN7014_c0_g1_i1.p1 TRINITY_DN7014_c0_g1~~TRINITY_DN7014_c0_g1_i1.p1  ORF type:complete len:69 (+),score=12.42 TRINITY_DN7014_c0_g1_i1:91-297(+)
MLQSYNPNKSVNSLVWASARSLAATSAITIVFYSSGYLDVSVLRVRLLAHVLCVDTGRSSETAKAHRG